MSLPPAGKIGISGDVVARATADLPSDERAAILWLYHHAVETGMSRDDVARAIRRAPNTVYQLFTGSHGASKEKIAAEILSYKQLVLARRGAGRLNYIETALARKIWSYCDSALTYQRIGFIYGDSQIGKTEALKKYRDDHNHGATIYVRMPTAGIFSHFMDDLCAILKLPNQLRERELRRRILSCFDSRNLLIIDEAHQCFNVSKRSSPTRCTRTLEFIREIYEKSECGVVIAATNIFRDELERGRATEILAQLKRRRLPALQLPAAPSDEDLDTFAAAYGLPPATGGAKEIQTEMIREEALGMWLTLLRMAANRASRAKRALTWADVQTARDGLRKLESVKS